MDDVTDLMGNVTLDINANYVQKDKTEEINVSQFTSDIDLMLLDSSSFSEDGFALLCPIKAPIKIYESNIESTNGFNYEYGYKVLFSTEDLSIKHLKIQVGDIISDNTSAVVQLCVMKNNTYLHRVNMYKNSVKDISIQGYSKIELRFYPGVPSSNTDFKYEVHNIALFREDSMVLPITSITLQDESMNTYDAIVQNWYASWNYLINFYLYDLPAYTATSNTLGLLYSSDIKKSMKHTIEFHIEEDLNELQLIKTSIGNGKIESVSVNLDTRLA